MIWIKSVIKPDFSTLWEAFKSAEYEIPSMLYVIFPKTSPCAIGARKFSLICISGSNSVLKSDCLIVAVISSEINKSKFLVSFVPFPTSTWVAIASFSLSLRSV